MINNKPAFYRIGNTIINRYEIREVKLYEAGDRGYIYPRAVVTYKDGSKVTVAVTVSPFY